ncbi:MAG: hypothetical protein NZO58_14815, partial [Gemmataceae bacterium]|nr:hypothetical protein [Gemmataceae bacterium]
MAGTTGGNRGIRPKQADNRTVQPTPVVLDSRGSRVEQVGFGWERGKIEYHVTLASLLARLQSYQAP